MSSEINDCVRRSLNRYFRDLDGQAPHAVYGMVLKCVERPASRLSTRITR